MPVSNILVLVVTLKVVMVAMAVVLAHLTYSAYQRSGSDDLRMLSVGFGSVLGGILLGGLTSFSQDLMLGVLVESLFVTLGLGFMIYSLYGYR